MVPHGTQRARRHSAGDCGAGGSRGIRTTSAAAGSERAAVSKARRDGSSQSSGATAIQTTGSSPFDASSRSSRLASATLRNVPSPSAPPGVSAEAAERNTRGRRPRWSASAFRAMARAPGERNASPGIPSVRSRAVAAGPHGSASSGYVRRTLASQNSGRLHRASEARSRSSSSADARCVTRRPRAKRRTRSAASASAAESPAAGSAEAAARGMRVSQSRGPSARTSHSARSRSWAETATPCAAKKAVAAAPCSRSRARCARATPASDHGRVPTGSRETTSSSPFRSTSTTRGRVACSSARSSSQRGPHAESG